jgi:hypothetical protein
MNCWNFLFSDCRSVIIKCSLTLTDTPTFRDGQPGQLARWRNRERKVESSMFPYKNVDRGLQTSKILLPYPTYICSPTRQTSFVSFSIFPIVPHWTIGFYQVPLPPFTCPACGGQPSSTIGALPICVSRQSTFRHKALTDFSRITHAHLDYNKYFSPAQVSFLEVARTAAFSPWTFSQFYHFLANWTFGTLSSEHLFISMPQAPI